MNIKILSEYGYNESILGLSLSYNQSIDKMGSVACRLYSKNGGHNKFLESIQVWIDITASRDFWQQFDTYRIGISKQSESTMHTILKDKLSLDNFEIRIPLNYLDYLNQLIENKEFLKLKKSLPEGFLQRRIVNANYKALRNIISQRQNHKLTEWQTFCSEIYDQIDHYEFFDDLFSGKKRHNKPN